MKWKLITLVILLITLAASVHYFPGHLAQYSRFIYYPFQALRGIVFTNIPFSIGDVLYVLSGLWLLITIVKWVYFLFHFRMYKEQLRPVCAHRYQYLYFCLPLVPVRLGLQLRSATAKAILVAGRFHSNAACCRRYSCVKTMAHKRLISAFIFR